MSSVLTDAPLSRPASSADATDAARAVRCPALVLTGEFDATCLPEAGARMADAIGATQHLLPGASHLHAAQARGLAETGIVPAGYEAVLPDE